MTKFDKYFPYATMRTEQREILEIMERAYDTNRKYIIIEAGTGIGKSAIAKSLSGYSQKSYLLTATKQLQDQYEHDFYNHNARVIKGKANYVCNLDDGLDCQNGLCKYRKQLVKQCGYECPYAQAKHTAFNSEMCVLSYAFFLGFVAKQRQLEEDLEKYKRANVIIDECHLMEDQLIQHATVTLNRQKLIDAYDIILNMDIREMGVYNRAFSSKKDNVLEEYLDWIQVAANKLRYYYDENTKRLIELHEKDVKNLTPDEISELEDSKALSKKLDNLETIVEKLEFFLDDCSENNWMVSIEDEDTLKIQPLAVDKLFKKHVDDMAKERIIFLSATILNPASFCRDLGIKKEDVCFIRKDGIFAPERSPIVDVAVGSMSYKNINDTMPKVYKKIREILNNHKGQKGIIHTGNYNIMNNIVKNVKSKRFLYRETSNNLNVNNEMILKFHSSTKKDTVLVSPSLMAGVDLADDLARFQIIVKMPYISLADKRVKYKMGIDNDWYSCKMLRNLVQACGRSTRSEDDWSVTYILDDSFCNIVKRFYKMLPDSFKNRIVVNNKFNLVEFYGSINV